MTSHPSINDLSLSGALPHTYWVINGGGVAAAEAVAGGVIEESLVSIYVNGEELATIMCSPLQQEALALGFLYNEGVIESLAEVGFIKANVPATTVDVLLTHAEFSPPRRMILTSGCGGGITLQDLTQTYPAIESNFSTTSDVIFARMRDLRTSATLYNAVRGVHTAILGDTKRVLLAAEDVGRHNAIDKLAGLALREDINTTDCILVASGRISSEMLGKARRMGIPLVVSRTAPTSTAIELAEAWNICIVGYVRQNTMRVYTHPWRVGIVDENK